MLHYLLILALFTLAGGAARELVAAANDKEDCSCAKGDGPQTIVTATTKAGDKVTLKFPYDPVRMAPRGKYLQAYLCSKDGNEVTEAKLRMKMMHNGREMEHGTTPTKVEAFSQQCSFLREVNPSMTGPWFYRVSFSNETTVDLKFKVAAAEKK